jgi:hypothetical protein
MAPVMGRITRWMVERREGTRIRFGATFRPLAAYYPDFLWSPGETYRDDYWIYAPPNARPGIYEVWLRVSEEPYSPVATLSEVWSNRLGNDWRRFGEVTIE